MPHLEFRQAERAGLVKRRLEKQLLEAFTLVELIVLLAILGIVGCILLPMLNRARIRSQSICCNCNLKQVGLAFKTWAIDHTNRFPMEISTNIGGTREYTATVDVFRHFQVMSNELSTPKVLICPRDTRQFASDFVSFANSNASYFVGIEAQDTAPQGFLAGDRNITNGTSLQNGILELTTNHLSGWTHDLHNRSGNVGLADGSVQQFSTLRLREGVSWTGTNRLAMP